MVGDVPESTFSGTDDISNSADHGEVDGLEEFRSRDVEVTQKNGDGVVALARNDASGEDDEGVELLTRFESGVGVLSILQSDSFFNDLINVSRDVGRCVGVDERDVVHQVGAFNTLDAEISTMMLGVAFHRVVVHDLVSSRRIGVVGLVGAVVMLSVAGEEGSFAGSTHDHLICFGFNDALNSAVGTHLNDVAEEVTH